MAIGSAASSLSAIQAGRTKKEVLLLDNGNGFTIGPDPGSRWCRGGSHKGAALLEGPHAALGTAPLR